ncbi:MAG: ABC transporter ATP-binding protein [Alphaproteobacteria bacterium]|nr:ABC transporter ATP-binding protein [Alphaproteobacteria bacterium]
MKELLHAVRISGLGYRYHDGTEALRGLDLVVHAGEKVCLAGPNGAGKSTLLLHMTGIIKGEGDVLVGGDVPKGAPSVFGLVFQDPEDQLFCPTVGDDVAFGPRNMKLPEIEVDRRVASALLAVGLEGFQSRSAHHLSGGEKKRAAIAAVLACEPEILALDEPWANLDVRSSRAVTDILRGHKGTFIVASQDLHRAAEVCERLVIIDGGAIVADGPMKELLADEELLEAHGLEFRKKCAKCEATKGDKKACA